MGLPGLGKIQGIKAAQVEYWTAQLIVREATTLQFGPWVVFAALHEINEGSKSGKQAIRCA